MRRFSISVVVSVLLASLSAWACNDPPMPEPANPGGVGPGKEGGTGGTAGAGGGNAGAGGQVAGGGGGAEGSTLPDVAGCTLAGATDGTAGAAEVAVADGSFSYTPKCLKVKAGTDVTFVGSSEAHPLAPMTKGSSPDNPIPASQEASVVVTFAVEGAFPYFCTNHGADGGTTGMVGAVYVVP